MITRLLLILLLGTTVTLAADDAGHPLRGVVTRKLEERKLVFIKHEEIPGFMRAMTMGFAVPDADWPKLAPGMHLTATLRGSRGDWRLSDLVLTNENYEPLVATPASAHYPLHLTELNSPAPPGASALTIFRQANGSAGLGWIETSPNHTATLRYALFDSTARAWADAETVATGTDWAINDLNCPQFALSANGTLTALWYVRNPSTEAPAHGNLHAVFSQKTVGGTWSTPAPLSRESHATEFAALTPLAENRVLAVWLDGRAKPHGSGTQQLWGRVLGEHETDQLIDDSVCDCCPTALKAFPNGDALVAYRAHRDEETRDIHTSVWREGVWSHPRILSADDWSIDGCPVNGPQIDIQAGQVAAVWFTAADRQPRVLASASPDAGARFLMPQRIDLGHPRGQPDVAQLRDGSRIVTWLEGGAQPGLWLRHISAQDEIGPMVCLAPPATGRPQIVLLKDYDASPAQILAAYTQDHGGQSTIKTLLITLPALSILAGRAPCLPCDEQDANASRGYGVKGSITNWPEPDKVTLRLEEIPGVMRAGTLTCQVEPGLQAALPVGQSLLGRIEPRDGTWWLFNVKLLSAPSRESKPIPSSRAGRPSA